MKFLVDARIVPGKDVDTDMDAEARRVYELVGAGLITQVMSRPDGTGAFLVLDAPDANAADVAMASLPFAASGAITVTMDRIEILDI
jgi:hypothetical protein